MSFYFHSGSKMLGQSMPFASASPHAWLYQIYGNNVTLTFVMRDTLSGDWLAKNKTYQSVITEI